MFFGNLVYRVCIATVAKRAVTTTAATRDVCVQIFKVFFDICMVACLCKVRKESVFIVSLFFCLRTVGFGLVLLHTNRLTNKPRCKNM